MLRSPNQIRTANQIRRSYKNDQSNIFVTVYFMTWKYLIPIFENYEEIF